jgi:tetratricopeptide (TPR) repeat protein
MNRRDRRAAAKGSRARNTPAAPSPTELYEAGLQHFIAGRSLEAQACCQKALALDAQHADTLHLMGLLSLHSKQYDHALEWISRAIGQQPKADYLAGLGTALSNLGRREEALATFEKGVELKPDHPASWRNLGNALADIGRSEDAILSFQRALGLNPGDWATADKCGSILFSLGRMEEALNYLDQSDKLLPNRAPILQKRAIALYGLNRLEEALAEIKRAHELEPGNADICNSVGVLLRRLGREEQALPWFDRALEIRPDFLAARSNQSFALSQLHRFTDAIAVYDEVEATDPGKAEADLYASLLHLLTGNFELGWAGRESRTKVSSPQIIRLEFPQPRWLGKERIDGKTILLHTDEGLGDAIQFLRYVPMVATLGARVVVVVPDAVCPLLSGLKGVSQCVPLSADALPAFDMYCELSSLPLAFGTRLDSIPSTTPYLSARAESLSIWEARLGARDGLRLGLVWSGNPAHRNDYNRSMPLSMLAPILDVGAQFFSLQKDPRPDDKAFLRARPEIVDHTAQLTDFAETAALISCLDLVITVDTSVAHLAGALGCPTWILLPHTPDWRWLLDREDSPWYPSARLFRQDETRDYTGVVARVRHELVKLVEAKKMFQKTSDANQ